MPFSMNDSNTVLDFEVALNLPEWAKVPKIDPRLDQALHLAILHKTKPKDSLGTLEKIAHQLGRIQQSLNPIVCQPALFVFAGDHGIAQNPGVSAFPSSVTAQMVLNFAQGGAAVNVFARHNGWNLEVIDVGVDFLFDPQLNINHAKVVRGTADSTQTDALSTDEVLECLEVGKAFVDHWLQQGADLFACGEMGIGNTASSSLILSALWGQPVAELTGRGTGVQDLDLKVQILTKARMRYSQGMSPLEILAAYGGAEIAAMVGAFLAAGAAQKAILVDGFIASTAFALAVALEPNLLEYAIFSHKSAEQAHQLLLKKLGARPILDLDLRLGEGTGAALALPIVQSACAMLREMATFESAGVDSASEE
jgi:nicotinate-nucleotide--dimethylbenzimidazole phosphoribosyltransferase